MDVVLEESLMSPSSAKDADERNEVAVKSDDAPIPVFVWRQQLERITGVSIPVDVYEAGADRLRVKLLCMWRRGLLRHFWLWVKAQHRELEASLEWCTSQFGWSNTPGAIKPDAPLVFWDRSTSSYRWFRKRQGVGRKLEGRFKPVGRKRYSAAWQLQSTILGPSKDGVKECMEKAAGCTWWKWDAGSRLFFWRWPKEYVIEARDGCKCWYNPSKLPRYLIPQRPPSNPEMTDKIREKLADVMMKLYIADGRVVSLTSFFDVLKGVDDIRMVYNGTSCGLNAACWAPWFPLPTVDTHMRTVEAGTWMSDIDLGEMFINFPLDEALRAYAGVDVTMYFPELLHEGKDTVWQRWGRLLMGFTASPYLACRYLLRARKILLGDRLNPSNPYRWEKVIKNYPGLISYNPLRPRVYKIRTDGKIAADLHKYIDDLRPTSVDEKEMWDASMQVMTRVNWLGMQNAARKFRLKNGLMPGAWKGALISTAGEVFKSLSQARWDKVKAIIERLIRIIEEDGYLEFKSLLSDRGFLTYVAQTHPAMVPFLKGFHLTIDSWRGGRDEEGWRVKMDYNVSKALNKRRVGTDEECLEEALAEAAEAVTEEVQSLKGVGNKAKKKDGKDNTTQGAMVDPPEIVYPAPRFLGDLKVLKEMTKSEVPIKQHVRAKRCDMVKFGFGDASGGGYGSALAKLLGEANIRHGRWALFYSAEETSSNFRELRNLVDAVALDYERGLLDGFELFLFTDNSVAEKAYYKGTSSSKKLFELVLKLRLIEMEGKMIIHVIHISGKRMIHCGIDGLSRGDTTDGIAAGITMDNYVPLHLDCLERSPTVETWVQSWWPREDFGKLDTLDENDWFIWDENKRNCLWTPAPAGGEASVEELGNWIHHTSERIHIYIIPTIWTCTWRKQLGKTCDLTVALPNVFSFWNLHQHFEPLTLAIFVPYLNREPWRMQSHPAVDILERKLREVQEDPDGSIVGNLLREFLFKARQLRRVL